MKFFKYILLFSFVFTACKSSKNTSDAGANIKIGTAKKVLKKHIAQHFNEKTADAKLKVNFKNEKQDLSVSVRMKIKKDEVIWLKGTKLITVFKAMITPEKVSFYSPYYKNYFEGDFKMLEEILGVSVNFKQLQNILLGQTMLDTSEKHKVLLATNNYKISPKNQADIFDVFYWINANHYKLDQQSIVNETNNQRLDITYPSYKKTATILFPESIRINGKAKNKSNTIDLLVRSVIFNEEISIPFTIPNGYKAIEL